ncbi:MAG TPA: molybdopterin-dependent oxidoreductase [Syntrophomonas sp.]|nr:molybdopterin-dependent oxidoreductase [Syntrophomonas sp.]
MDVSRRQFLKIGGGGVATVIGASLIGNNLIDNNEPNTLAASAPEKVIYKHGVCGICELSCAMKGKIENGRLVKLEGKSVDQHSRGSLCAKGNSGINMLYDPDRLKYPMVKTVPGRVAGQDPKWKKVSWDDAINQASAAIKKAIDKYGPQSVIWIGHHKGVDFLNAIGSPNDISHQSTCNNVRQLATQLVLGAGNYVPDFENSKYILCFGWDQLGKAKNSFARGPMHAKNENGAKLVVFDPRLSTTAAKANEWIPIRPGTDLAVILAMLNVVISEGHINQEYVEQYVFGYEELAAEVKKYTPEWAAKLSDVPADTIRRIAREFSGGCPALIPIHKREAIQSHPGGFELVRACLALMAITGNIERKGAIMLPRVAALNNPRAAKTPPAMKETRRVDGGHMFPLSITKPNSGPGLYQSVPDMILADQPYPVKVAIIYGQSLQSMPNPQKWLKAFEKLDYIININVNPDEIATIADVVLPESCYLERAEISARLTNARYPQIAISEPMVKELHDTKDAEEIKYLIAKKLGLDKYMTPIGDKALDFKLKKYGVTYKQSLEKGAIISGPKEFVPKVLTELKTESGKIQLYSPKLKEMGYHPLPWFDERWVLKSEKNDEFHLVTTRPPTHRHAKTHNMKWLHEITPKGVVYMNASRARKLGINDADMIEMTTSYGQGTAEVKLTEGIRPDTICFQHGFGQKSPLMKLAYQDGMNDGEIMPSFNKEFNLALNDPTGACLDCHMLVKVKRA